MRGAGVVTAAAIVAYVLMLLMMVERKGEKLDCEGLNLDQRLA